MGLCGSAEKPVVTVAPEEREQDNQITHQLNQEKKEKGSMKKLLLLGPGESGKSTFFKQMVIGHGGGISREMREQSKSVILLNCLEFGCKLGQWVKAHAEEYKFGELAESFTEALSNLSKSFVDPDSPEANRKVLGDLKTIWADDKVKLAWEEHRSKIQIPESTAHFLSNLDKIFADGYVPTDTDVILLRNRTTGIKEQEFLIEGLRFLLVDVGGQRSERKKWVSCFSDVTAVIFIVAIGEYDQTLFEDETVNRLQEAMKLFEEIVNLPAFQKTTFVLFFNKYDMFVEKIKKTPVTVCFPEYSGDSSDPSLVGSFIQDAFLLKAKAGSSREMFTHYTCATDTEKTLAVFDSVKRSIISSNLQSSHLE